MGLSTRKKGFTLIEIIVTMAIFFMTLAIVSPLLNYNLKSLYVTESKNDLQREAYGAMENFTKRAMEANNIIVLKNESGIVDLASYTTSSSISINEIEFSTDDVDPRGTVSYNFKLQDEILRFTENVTTESTITAKFTNKIAYNVKSITVEPNAQYLKDIDGFKITFEFSKRLVEKGYKITSQVKFRNWKPGS